MSRATQYDLFGEEERQEFELSAWIEQFERRPMVCGNGVTVLGWVCPDCGETAANEFLLQINHGWWTQVPGMRPMYGGKPGTCTRQRLLGNQRRAAERKEAS